MNDDDVHITLSGVYLQPMPFQTTLQAIKNPQFEDLTTEAMGLLIGNQDRYSDNDEAEQEADKMTLTMPTNSRLKRGQRTWRILKAGEYSIYSTHLG